MRKTTDYENELELDFETPESTKEKTPYEKWAKVAFFGVAAFLFSQLDFFYGLSPFSVAFLGAIPFEFCFSAFVGGALGSFTALTVGNALKSLGALFIVCVLRNIKGRYFNKTERDYINAAFSLAGVLISSVVKNAFDEVSFEGYLFMAYEGTLAFFGTLLFLKSFRTPFAEMKKGEFSVKESLYLCTAFCTFIMCGACFTIEGISPIRLLSFLLILFVGSYKGVYGASAVGVAVALSLSINEDYRFLFAALSLGAFLSGVVSPLGQTLSAIAFAFTVGGLSAFSGDYGIISVIEAVIASAVFIVIPGKHIASFQSFMHKKGLTADDKVAETVSESLREAAENIYGVSALVSEVSEKLQTVINPEVNRMFAFLQQKVCDGCPKKFLCWNRNFDLTASDVLTIAGVEKKAGITLKKTCPKYDELSLSIDEAYRDFAESLQTKNKLSEMRRVLTDQFSSMGDFLNSTANSVSESRIPDKGRAAVIKTALSDSGIYLDYLSCYLGSNSKMTVEMVSFDSKIHEEHKKIKAILEFITKRRFEKADITVKEIKTVIVFEERTAFEVQVGLWQKPMKDGTVCGDTVSVIGKRNGSATVILSDGMGTGARAKIDSTMTSSIMEKLIYSGFDFDSALKIVNSSMIIKSTDESIATIDALSVNLFTGKAVLYKAGASLTFIRRGTEITVIEAPSLPVGIIRKIEFFKAEKDLQAGDIVLMVSDGASVGDCGWINDELLSWNTGSMNDLACHIVRLASLRADDNSRDDITAVAVKIK